MKAGPHWGDQPPCGGRREGWDSNPRRSKPRSGFRDRPNRPLWHLPTGHYNIAILVEQVKFTPTPKFKYPSMSKIAKQDTAEYNR
jgi:hypothetical protein